MRYILLLTVLTAVASGQPVKHVAGARFRAADLAKAREFYTKVFGFQEKSGTGQSLAVFQINGEQYLEFSQSSETTNPLETIAFGVSQKPGAPLKDPDGRRVEFVQSPASARSFKASEKSVSEHLLHVGMGATDMQQSIDFYASRLGCKETFRRPDFKVLIMRVPGPREDWIEFILRGESGSDHIGLDVPDIQKAYKTLLERGATIRGKPRIASNGHWVINMMDTNGIRVELMEPRPAPK
jgi:catechol 2,3-dioxygenase-like lactoylglutathione lyase family enzyme